MQSLVEVLSSGVKVNVLAYANLRAVHPHVRSLMGRRCYGGTGHQDRSGGTECKDY